jgi:hypothetical protein
VQIGAEAAHGETDVWVANVPADIARLFRACLSSVARSLNSGPGAALEVPGCTSLRNLHAHHVLFRSAGGGDDLSNLTTLCAAHHQRGVHAGVIRIRGRAPEQLVFEMPLGRFRSGDRVMGA